MGGSDGLRSDAGTTTPGVVRVAAVGLRTRYARLRTTRLSDVEKAQIVARADSTTLRALASEFGVSHETIRKVFNEATRARTPT